VSDLGKKQQYSLTGDVIVIQLNFSHEVQRSFTHFKQDLFRERVSN